MDRYITLGDGQTVIPDAYAAEAAPGVIFLYIEDPEATLRSVFDLLYENEDLTEEITSVDYGEKKVFTEYCALFSVRRESERLITAGLRRWP